MKYLVVTNGDNHYFLSNSRNSIKHMNDNNAKNCWIYNKGLWISFAEKTNTGQDYHPKMFLDGELKQFYIDKQKELKSKNR